MVNKRTAKKRPPELVGNGKQRLLDAALRLSARGSSLSSLGLRELAREADLNHNTFYRHYADMEDLSRAAAEMVATQIMAGMKEVRRNAARHGDATRGAAEYFLDFVRQNPAAFIVGLRELHNTMSPMRGLLRQVMDDIATESVEQILSMNLAPGLNSETLRQATTSIAYYMFYRSLDYIEHPEQRVQIIEQIVNFSRMQFFGAATQQQMQKPPATTPES